VHIKTIGKDRKEMVKSIGEFLGQKPVYVGPPSFSYEVAGFIIERDGTVVSESEEEGEKMKAYLVELGFAEQSQEVESLEVSMPMDGMDGLALFNIISMIKSKQYLLNKVLRKEHFSISDAFIETLQINLPESKEAFLKMYNENIEAILGLSFEDDKITFTYPASENLEKNRAYVELTAKMVDHAKEAKRISPKAIEPENEKYYLRIWLVRLGLGGKDAKASRKALLEGLTGHTAFRTPADEKKHKARRLEIKQGGDHELNKTIE